MLRFKLNIPVFPAEPPASGLSPPAIGRLASVRAHPWIEDICEEFRRRGYDIYSLPNFADVPEPYRRDPQAQLAFAQSLANEIARLGGVDILLSGNATSILPMEHEGRRCTLGEALGVPTIAWWWDDPRLDMHALVRCGLISAFDFHKILAGPELHHFMIDRAMADEYSRFLGFAHVSHLPVAASLDRFCPPAIGRHRDADLVFIGNHYSTEGVKETAERHFGPGADVDLVKPLCDLRRRRPLGNLRELFKEWSRSAPIGLVEKLRPLMEVPTDARHFDGYHALWKIVTYSWCSVRNETVQACERALGRRFTLYGQRWHSMGVESAGYIRDMPSQNDWYQRSRLGLSGNHGQLQTGLPFRIWELANCGACIVTQESAELANYFEPDRECITYREADEAVEKIHRLLAEPERASQIAAAGHRRALACHQWSNRVDVILNQLGLRHRVAITQDCLSGAS